MPDTQTPAEAQAIEYATEVLFATLDNAKAARKNARFKDLTVEAVSVSAPYAKEWRLILSTVAQHFNVFAVGTPNGVGGKYRTGYTVRLFGFAPDITLALEVWEQIRDLADTGMKASTPGDGEDTGTHRSSWLLGFQLGLAGFDAGDVDEQTAVEERISGPISQNPLDVRMRSTGSGAWAGYQTARRVRLVPADATADSAPVDEPAEAA